MNEGEGRRGSRKVEDAGKVLEGRGMAVSWEMTAKLMLSEGHILMMFESWSWSQ